MALWQRQRFVLREKPDDRHPARLLDRRFDEPKMPFAADAVGKYAGEAHIGAKRLKPMDDGGGAAGHAGTIDDKQHRAFGQHGDFSRRPSSESGCFPSNSPITPSMMAISAP